MKANAGCVDTGEGGARVLVEKEAEGEEQALMVVVVPGELRGCDVKRTSS